jgi:outer membrane protein assembly factor BamB
MQSKFICILVLSFFWSCSTDKEIDVSKYVSVYENPITFNFVEKKNKKNSQLADVINIKNIYNPEDNQTSNAMINFPLEKIWEIDTNQDINDENPLLPKPIFILSNIYILNNKGSLFKINSSSGKIIWQKKIFEDLENTIIGTPALSARLSQDGKIILYLHNGFDELVAFNEDNGNRIWSKKTNLPFRGGITVSENSLFLSDFEGNFYSIKNKNGEIEWTTFLGNDPNSIYTSARPILADNKIVVPGTGGSFFVISQNKGEVLWTDNISSNKQLPKLFHSGDIIANPLYSNDVVYIVSQSGVTSAFNINTSEELWSVPVGGFETPSLSGESLFVNGNMGLLVVIDTKTGNLRWKNQFPKYINADSYFAEKELALYKGPTLVNSHILFSNQNGRVMIINANTSEETASIKVGKLAISPMPAEKKVFFLTVKGKLIAYE